MELNAGDSFVFTVVMFKERPIMHVYRRYLGSSSRFIVVTQHFKVVLENIYELIRLKGFLNPVGNSVNEFFKLLCNVLILLGVLLHLRNEVSRVILHTRVH